MSWFFYPLLVFSLVGAEAFASADGLRTLSTWVDNTRSNCETTNEGITYCVEDGGDIHIVIIDLDNPTIRFDMVMADDVTNVDTTRRERIEDMVQRSSYGDQELVVAINADYFGWDHGPEGLAVKNGRRLDAEGDQYQNPHALWRSSLAISRLNQVSVGRKSADELDHPRAFRERFYNAVGGGPLILNYGVVIPNVVACLIEQFPVGACRRTIQTAVGLSEDQRRLFLAVGRGRDIEGFARLLRDYGAFTAIKLDGGGSSQMWYDGSMRHDSNRPVGNALLVLRSPVPRHDARFTGSSACLVVQPGERVEVNTQIQNTGFLDWQPDLGYRFKNVQGWPAVGPAYQRLPEPVLAGGLLTASLNIVAPQSPGLYETEWQLVHQAEPIGSRLWMAVAVVPAGSAETGLTEQIESRLAACSNRPGSENEWPALRQEIEREILEAVESELSTALSAEDDRPITLFEAIMRTWWMPLIQRLPW